MIMIMTTIAMPKSNMSEIPGIRLGPPAGGCIDPCEACVPVIVIGWPVWLYTM